jgi:GNAT superfamily N-acetyltransferase
LKHGEYDIRHARPEHRDDIVRVLGHLLDGNHATREAYFRWKYEQNPHADELLGIVALRRGRVAGFRGYAASRWRADDDDPLTVLTPGDTCVHPEHRHKKLSVAMGRLALADYATRYPLLLNLSCTRTSLPGYLRLGFQPVAQKRYLSSYRLTGLAHFLLRAKERRPAAALSIRSDEAAGLVFSRRPRPQEMAELAARQPAPSGRLRLVQDLAWFRWRFADPAGRFVFYFRQRRGTTTGYIALALSPNARRAYIVDHADCDGESCADLLAFCVSERHFDVVSIYEHASESLRAALDRNGFGAGGIVGALEKRVRGNMPLLVRPTNPEPAENDWRVAGRDVRKPESWSIRGICSDST